jgi:hypothetical protein
VAEGPAGARAYSSPADPRRGAGRDHRGLRGGHLADELPPPRDELLRRVAGCDGILTLLTDRVDDELLDAAGRSSVS